MKIEVYNVDEFDEKLKEIQQTIDKLNSLLDRLQDFEIEVVLKDTQFS